MRLFPKFFPKTITKIIEQNKPTYYDLQGNIIVKANSNLNIIPSISQPIHYDLNADTTATILSKGEAVLKNDVEKVTPSVVPMAFTVAYSYCKTCKKQVELHKDYTKKLTKNNKLFISGTGLCGHKCGQFTKV